MKMIVRTGLSLALWSQFADALSAYYSYQDALCVDDNTIEGTFVMSFDDPDYADYGFSMDYTGECLYFTEGSLNLDNSDACVLDSIDFGSCVECNGVTGCSSDGTCSNFKTYATPVSSNSYQLSQGSSAGKEEQAAPKFGAVAKKAGESAESIVSAHHHYTSSRGGESSGPETLGLFVFAVAFAGVVGAALVAILVSRKRNKGANQALTESILAEGVEMGSREHQSCALA
jgi:hypothetical protein